MPLPGKISNGYDWRKTLLSAAKVGVFAAAGFVVADEANLTAYIASLLGPEWSAIGGIVIASAFAALKNWLSNRQRVA